MSYWNEIIYGEWKRKEIKGEEWDTISDLTK